MHCPRSQEVRGREETRTRVQNSRPAAPASIPHRPLYLQAKCPHGTGALGACSGFQNCCKVTTSWQPPGWPQQHVTSGSRFALCYLHTYCSVAFFQQSHMSLCLLLPVGLHALSRSRSWVNHPHVPSSAQFRPDTRLLDE